MKYGLYNVGYNTLFRSPEQFFAIEQRENMVSIFKYLKSNNWHDDPIKAIIACLCVLSSCNPWLLPQGVDFEHPETLASNTGAMGLQQFAPGRQLYEFMLQHNLDPRNGDSSLFKIRWDYANNLEWRSMPNYPNWQSFWEATGTTAELAPIVIQAYFHIAQIPEALYNVCEWMDKYFSGTNILSPLELAITCSDERRKINYG